MALTYKALAVLLAYPTAETQDLATAAVQAIEDEGMVPAQISTLARQARGRTGGRRPVRPAGTLCLAVRSHPLAVAEPL